MKATIKTITPTMAEQILNRNEKNRKLSPPRVATFAAEMKAGRWESNGESIIIDSDGYLLDGQHRLAAIVESGLNVPMLVVTDVPRKVQKTIDTGRTRSNSDILGFNGVSNPQGNAAAASVLWRLFHQTGERIGIPSTYVVEVIQRYPDIIEWTRRYMANYNARRVIPVATLVPALVYLQVIAKRPDLAERLFEGVSTGANLEQGDPILALRNRVMGLRAQRVPMSSTRIWPMLARTVSALEGNEELTRIKFLAGTTDLVRPTLFDTHTADFDDTMKLADLLPPTNISAVRHRESARKMRMALGEQLGKALPTPNTAPRGEKFISA